MSAAQGFTRRFRSALVAVALGLVATLALAGCATGQRAATAVETPVVDGVEANVGNINIRDAAVNAPSGNYYQAGSNATLTMVIVNSGETDDSLTGVTTSVAKSAKFFADAADVSSSGSLAQSSIALAHGESTRIGIAPTDQVIQLTDLSSDLEPSTPINITLSFANAGSVTMNLTVRLSTNSPGAPTLATTHPDSND